MKINAGRVKLLLGGLSWGDFCGSEAGSLRDFLEFFPDFFLLKGKNQIVLLFKIKEFDFKPISSGIFSDLNGINTHKSLSPSPSLSPSSSPQRERYLKNLISIDEKIQVMYVMTTIYF